MAILPIPALDGAGRSTLIELARCLSELAEEREAKSARWVVGQVLAGRVASEAMRELSTTRDRLLEEMKSLQNDLDWCVYRAFNLVPIHTPSHLGGRGDVSEQRAGWLRELPNVQMIETPVFKRLWEGRRGVFGHNVMSLADEVRDASVDWLAERAEVWIRAQAEPRSLPGLRRELGADDSNTRVVNLAGEMGRGLADGILRDAVPFLAALRHTDSGLEKRAAWERVWDLQRAEDRGEQVPPFDPAPKYDQTDYREPVFWRLRGKLDVPKERFISYPGCESDEDKEPIYGWAGWNHLQQAQALAALYQKRKVDEAWSKDRLTPMLAGILELVPWVKQWHNEPSQEFDGLKLGDYFESFLDAECLALGLTRDDLRAWRPAEKTRGRAAAAKRKAPEPEPEPEPGAPVPAPAKRARRKKAAPDAPAEGE